VKSPTPLGENTGNLFDKRSRDSLQRRTPKNRGPNKDRPERGSGKFPSGRALRNRPHKPQVKAKRCREQRHDGCPRTELDAVAAAAQVIRAELFASNMAVALGIHVKSYAPILKLCRRLVAHGIEPAAPLEAWRGPTLCLRVRSIGAAAALEVRPASNGRPVFVNRNERTVSRSSTPSRLTR
jgi:hypothetical protein